jgi:branched-chain amino acid transport system permease protein
MAANIRPAGVFDTTYEQDIALNRTRMDRLLSNGGFILLLLAPLLTVEGPFGLNVVPQYWVGTLMRIAILVIVVQGLNILVGYTGQQSLGHAAFMAVGAYSAAIMARQWGFSFWVTRRWQHCLPAWWAAFGLPSLRVKGFYLVMATLAAQFIIPWVLRYPLEPLTNGSRPLEVPVATLGPISFAHDTAMYYIVIPLAVFLMLAARNLMRTGRAGFHLHPRQRSCRRTAGDQHLRLQAASLFPQRPVRWSRRGAAGLQR